MIKVIAFDADDTLWDCQSYFSEVERQYCKLLAPYCDAEKVTAALFQTEMRNMAELGYGCKAFTLSLIENAISITDGRITAKEIGEVLALGRSLLHLTAEPLPEVRETLSALDPRPSTLNPQPTYRLAVLTKGDLIDQRNKLRRSGLEPFFDHVSIVADKTEDEYRQLCKDMDIKPEELLMVGNSFKSDIEPALAIGAYAAYIPFHVTWAHEHTETYDHERLVTLSRFSELCYLLNGHV